MPVIQLLIVIAVVWTEIYFDLVYNPALTGVDGILAAAGVTWLWYWISDRLAARKAAASRFER
jgi:hypothetical protein